MIDPVTGAIKRTGESGEVCSRGHCNFVGYWAQKQQQTDEAVDLNRWYHSGYGFNNKSNEKLNLFKYNFDFNSDMGFMDESGYLFINGRIKDMIIRGGENIYPKEIEDFLMSNPLIADAHVIHLILFIIILSDSITFDDKVVGVPHDRLGEDLVAYIKLKNSSSLDPSAVREFCKGKVRTALFR